MKLLSAPWETRRPRLGRPPLSGRLIRWGHAPAASKLVVEPMMSPKLRHLILFAVFGLASVPSQAQATPPKCSPLGLPDNPCTPVYCEASGVSYAADCRQVHAAGIAGPYLQCEPEAGGGSFCNSVEVGGVPGVVKGLGILLLLGAFWVLPGALVYRAAKARGLDAGAVLGSWLVFGWLGVSYHLFKAVPRQNRPDPAASPPIDYSNLAGGMQRAAQRIADAKAAKRSR